MVAQDLVQLDEGFTVLFEPGGEAAVQVGANALRERVVGGVADQQMPKPVRIVTHELRAIRPHKLLADQRTQPLVDLAVAISHRGNRTPMKEAALDRAALQDGTFGGVELVEPGSQQRLNRRRNLNARRLAVAGQGEHLFQEQRISLGNLHDPRTQLAVDTPKLREQSFGLVDVEQPRTIVVVAVARELAGHLWALATME